MRARLLLGVAIASLVLSLSGVTPAEERRTPYVRIAELEIDPAQLENYKAAVREEMETSIRTEPGVIASAHFRKYVQITKDMIRSRKLLDTVPVQLSTKK